MSEGEVQVIELINNFFLKSALLLEQSKVAHNFDTEEALRDGNHLFNIETRGDPLLEAQIQPWITFDGVKTMPPLVIETYLDLRALQPNHMAVSYTHLDVYKRQAIELDKSLLEFSGYMKALGYPTDISSVEDLISIMDGIKIHVLGSLKLWEFYAVNIDALLKEVADQWDSCLLYTSRCV